MKSILLACLLLIAVSSHSQYIGIRAKYTETRLVDDSPKPPKRENRMILYFYDVTFNGTSNVWTPIALSNYDLWIYKEGLQYGNLMGGVLDSTGNNYPGYPFPAPRVVSYHNSLGIPYVDCNPNIATHYVVNGLTLDCGFIPVSYHDTDWGTGNAIECFPAPNILLPMYSWPHPYQWNPGNVNFGFGDLFPGPPYNLYSFSCGGSQQMVYRGLLTYDTGSIYTPLPVNFAYVRGEIQGTNTANISWTNLTESDIDRYEVQRTIESNPFVSIDTIAPAKNNSERADYDFSTTQTDKSVLYRIKAVEYSGKIIYSNIVSLRLADRNGPAPDEPVLTVFPNPAIGNQLSYRLSNAEKGMYMVTIVGTDARQYHQIIIQHDGGDITGQLELPPLPNGIYHLLLRTGQQTYSQKVFIIQ